MQNIEIKKIDLSNVLQLQAIGKATFHETFAEENTAENMEKYLEEGFSIDKLTAELNNKETEFYFAVIDNIAVGYLKINVGNAQTEMLDASAVEIERIYVLKAFHGQQVGKLLLEQALQITRQHHAPYIWLGVWEKNGRAIQFYTKNGFEAFDQHIFMLGEDKQTDILMKLSLEH
jgi:ribosomal protein S18 acetylase RimI-like enzyme